MRKNILLLFLLFLTLVPLFSLGSSLSKINNKVNACLQNTRLPDDGIYLVNAHSLRIEYDDFAKWVEINKQKYLLVEYDRKPRWIFGYWHDCINNFKIVVLGGQSEYRYHVSLCDKFASHVASQLMSRVSPNTGRNPSAKVLEWQFDGSRKEYTIKMKAYWSAKQTMYFSNYEEFGADATLIVNSYSGIYVKDLELNSSAKAAVNNRPLINFGIALGAVTTTAFIGIGALGSMSSNYNSDSYSTNYPCFSNNFYQVIKYTNCISEYPDISCTKIKCLQGKKTDKIYEIYYWNPKSFSFFAKGYYIEVPLGEDTYLEDVSLDQAVAKACGCSELKK